jgi:hypothetical protein
MFVRYAEPVAFRFVALTVPEFVVAIFPVVMLAVTAVREFINAVAKLKIFPRIFVTVVLPKVDEPVVKKLAATSVPVFVEEEDFSPVNAAFCPVIFVTVVDARVVEPAVKFVVLRFVEVEFVIVPLVELILVKDKFPAERVVMVALVIVEFPITSPFALKLFPERLFVTVKLLAVVLARVDDPDTIKFVK